MTPVKVFSVDDSAVVRKVMQEILSADPGIQFLGAAPDPLFAYRRMEREWPDVVVLDIEMPRMDGITFLRKLMGERPTPVVICSSLTEAGAETTMEAMQAGAVGIVTKPKLGLKGYLEENRALLLDTIKSAARANMHAVGRQTRKVAARPVAVAPKLAADAVLPAQAPGRAMHQTTDRVVAIGTSTGGTQALEVVLTGLAADAPGVAVVQHMPEKFTAAFAQRLDRICRIEVREARDGDRLRPGLALIAPGGRHMLVRRNGAHYHVEVVDGPLVSRHRPSVDVLFRSVAQAAGRNALGIIMTGMGDDGAAGLLEMRDAGASTLAQDEKSCVVYGMPKEAVKRGAAARSVPLDWMADEIADYGRQHK